MKGTTMQLKVSVISDRPDEYVGKKGLVKSQIITCQDVDPSGYRLLMPFDYTLSEDEKPSGRANSRTSRLSLECASSCPLAVVSALVAQLSRARTERTKPQ
jgi:hypothetical protein